MTQHDFRQQQLKPKRTLIECRTVQPGRYQVTGTGDAIKVGDSLLVSLKGSRELSMQLHIEHIEYLINAPEQWTATASGPVFNELAIHQWQVQCDGCGSLLELEFAVDASLGQDALLPAAEARLTELGWQNRAGRHLCRHCQSTEA